MTTVGDKIEEVRSMLRGSLLDEISVLSADYVAGVDTQIQLQYAKPNLQAGNIFSVGLNTFYGLQITGSGATVVVQPQADGGPHVNAATGDVVRIRPAHTTWSIYREWCSELVALSSPDVGLYSVGYFETTPDYVNNIYPLPATPPFDTQTPLRLLETRYKIVGMNQWQRVYGTDYQTHHATVRVFGETPNASLLRFVFAFPYYAPTDLTTTLTTLGLSPEAEDIPGLGAAMQLALTDEARRGQIQAQGDARRPTEVPSGANTNVAKMFAAKQAQRIAQESARLQTLYGYAQMTGISGEESGWGWAYR